MKDLNRLKVVLVEQNKTGKWLAEQLGKSLVLSMPMRAIAAANPASKSSSR